MTLRFKRITWWPEAFHVYDGDDLTPENRIGLVNKRTIRVGVHGLAGGVERTIWEAHNNNFFQVVGEFTNRLDAAKAIPKGPVHQPVDAFSGHH